MIHQRFDALLMVGRIHKIGSVDINRYQGSKSHAAPFKAPSRTDL